MELIHDPGFRQGFTVLAPRAGEAALGRIQTTGMAAAPLWELAQWHSRLPLTNHQAANPGEFCVSNHAKWLAVERPSKGPPVLTLGLDSRPEYDGRLRGSPAEPWVHLLVQQNLREGPSLAALESLRLRLDVRLREAETFRPAGYSPDRHAAQFQVVLTVNNRRTGSPGFGDYLWFVVPVYDDRHDIPPPYVAEDFAVSRGKLIFNPGAAAVGLKPMQPGRWQSLDCELRPWLDRALKAAWEKGYLTGSRDPADYGLVHLNLGWEVPGLNRVAMDVRGLSLRATSAGEATPPVRPAAETPGR